MGMAHGPQPQHCVSSIAGMSTWTYLLQNITTFGRAAALRRKCWWLSARSVKLASHWSDIMRWMPATLIVMTCCWNAGWAVVASHAAELPTNDYPTVARADYVFGCMQVNGQTRDALERCSCSIDVIASLLPYDLYEEAETIMRVRQRGGKNASMFLSMSTLRAKVDDLKRAQVEAELRCF
jgi:hypothetical protein